MRAANKPMMLVLFIFKLNNFCLILPINKLCWLPEKNLFLKETSNIQRQLGQVTLKVFPGLTGIRIFL